MVGWVPIGITHGCGRNSPGIESERDIVFLVRCQVVSHASSCFSNVAVEGGEIVGKAQKGSDIACVYDKFIYAFPCLVGLTWHVSRFSTHLL